MAPWMAETGAGVEDRQIAFFLPGQWCAVRLDLAAGRYRVRLRGDGPLAGRWRLVNETGEPRGEGEVVDGVAEMAVTEAGRVLLYLHLGEGARVRAVGVAPRRSAPPPAPADDAPG
jgi:hypothetical protein